jgi:hypothetical protein
MSRGASRAHVPAPSHQFTYQVVHVNAEFANQASDHDPQVVDIKP